MILVPSFGRLWPVALILFPLSSMLSLAQTAPNWTTVRPLTFPPARCDGGMAYDAALGQVVLFGGQTIVFGGNNIEYGELGDTWLWDGTNFTLQSPKSSPPAEYGLNMGYDSAHGQIFIASGFIQTPPFPLGNKNGSWVWDGTNWTQESPENSLPPRAGAGMAYDAAHGQFVVFGGRNVTPNSNGLNTTTTLGDTWTWDGVNWTQQFPKTSPTPRDGPAMVYDAVHGQTVLFGGSIVNATTFVTTTFNETWVWDGTNWTLETPQTSPPARSSSGMAYDSGHGKTVLFGGVDVNLNLLSDTWVWDGTNWTQESPQTNPPALSDFNITYDATHNQTIVFGGIDSTGEATNAIWAFSLGPLVPAITAVVNGASFVGGGVVPGEIATAFGTNLTSTNGINLTSGLPLPTTFLTDSLTVNNQQAALFAVDNVNGQQQYNFQVPWEVSSGPTVTISASNNSTSSASITVPVLTAQPGIFNYSAGGNTYGAILHANFQLANTANPAKPGETVLIYCTGLGAVSSPPEDGEPGNAQMTMATPTVTIGGTKAMVSFSGLAPGFVGLYQVNAVVPESLAAGNQPVIVDASGAFSNSVFLPVEN
jgi:uncharacterized protein (TIGR03437 family)